MEVHGSESGGGSSTSDTDEPGEDPPCPHVYFGELDVQWTLGASAQDLVAADLDGDGLPELVIPRDRSEIVVLRNLGRDLATRSHTFEPPAPIEGSNSWAVAVTDWNGDGRPDLVANGGQIILLANQGNLKFEPVGAPVRVEHSSERVAVADMNGDGREDIIAYGGRGMTIYPAPDQSGVLGDPVSVELGALGLRRGDVGDLDGDGFPDLVMAAWGADPFLVVAHGDGSGGFGHIAQYRSSEDMQGLEAKIVDVDADGILDVVVVGHTRTEPGGQNYVNRKPRLVWMRGDTAGTLTQAAVLELSPGAMGWSLAHGDLRSNGKSEVVALAGGIPVPNGEDIMGAFHLLSHRPGGLENIAPGFIEADTTWSHILITDLDGDGRQDLVRASGGVAVHWGCVR